MYQALYRKWRPKTFSDVVGQEHITETLRKQVSEGRLSHAYLFTGTRGTGKTTCARILAKAVNCEHPENGNPCNKCASCLGIENGSFLDVTELDAASNNGVDHVRALRDEAIYSPAQVKRRIYIIDEVHMLSTPAFNALLKILEEPPEHLMFILATTELHKVPATILSRCQRFAFRRITPQDITARIDSVAAQEGIALTPDGAQLLARLADGALRDALSLLDQCAAAGGSIDAHAVLETLGLAGNLQTARLMECVLRRDAKAALLLFSQLHAGGKDVSAVLGELATLTRDLLISATAPEGGASLLSGGFDAQTMAQLQSLVSPARLIAMASTLQRANADMQISSDRRVDAELCLLRLCDEGLSGDLDALNARIARLEELVSVGAHLAAAHTTPIAPEAPPAAPVSQATHEELDAPPPYGEPIEPVEAESPAPDAPAASVAAESPADTGNTEVWRSLLENYKSRLTADKRAFIGMVDGRLDESGLLTVYCATDLQKNVLDTESVAAVLREVTSAAIGREIRVRFLVGVPAGYETRDKLQDLLQLGNQFDLNIK